MISEARRAASGTASTRAGPGFVAMLACPPLAAGPVAIGTPLGGPRPLLEAQENRPAATFLFRLDLDDERVDERTRRPGPIGAAHAAPPRARSPSPTPIACGGRDVLPRRGPRRAPPAARRPGRPRPPAGSRAAGPKSPPRRGGAHRAAHRLVGVPAEAEQVDAADHGEHRGLGNAGAPFAAFISSASQITTPLKPVAAQQPGDGGPATARLGRSRPAGNPRCPA